MLSLEWHLALKLRAYKVFPFSGVTTFEERRERVRQAIRHFKLRELECWAFQGKGESFECAFRRVYGEAV